MYNDTPIANDRVDLSHASNKSYFQKESGPMGKYLVGHNGSQSQKKICHETVEVSMLDGM